VKYKCGTVVSPTLKRRNHYLETTTRGSSNCGANGWEENIFGGFSVPVSADHTLQVLSLEAVISLLPSGENCTRGTNM
jgi:hypothetical protein